MALLVVPALYALVAATRASRGFSTQARWAVAVWASTAAAGFAFLSTLWLALAGPSVLLSAGPAQAGAWIQASARSDILSCVVLLLVTFVGWVIVRYSRTYLSGEPGQPRYIASLMLTLAAVSVVVITNNAAVLAVAWLLSSLALHRLLTFYADRPAALIAAHKKFLASRLADICLFGAVALLWLHFGTLEIDRIVAASPIVAPATPVLTWAVLLLVVTALLKCAQLPMHGWLIQVMEAPTPVSALLHAGVVNLGGLVLIRFAPLLSEVPSAQVLLVVVGSLTAALAALVMMTRISIKVNLAWSTCAQMGFMLMECGLGWYELALLHLVAHSLYKAHAFLSAGGAVEQARIKQLAVADAPPGLGRSALAAAAATVVVALAALAWQLDVKTTPTLWAVVLIAGLSLAPMLATRALDAQAFVVSLATVFAVAFLLFGLHALALAGVPTEPLAGPHTLLLSLWVALLFVAVYGLQSWLRAYPHGRLSHQLFPYFYGGLFLDEAFTRLTFLIWPLARVTPPEPVVPHRAGTAASTEAAP